MRNSTTAKPDVRWVNGSRSHRLANIFANISASSLSPCSCPSLNVVNILSLLGPFGSTPLFYILRPHELSSIRLFCIHIHTYLSYEYTGITILVCAFFPLLFPFFPSRIRTLSLFSNSIHVAFVAPSPSFCPQCSTWTILPKAFACSPHDHSPFLSLPTSLTMRSDRARTLLTSCTYKQQVTSIFF